MSDWQAAQKQAYDDSLRSVEALRADFHAADIDRLMAENAELKEMLREVLEAHPHIEPKPGCLICQALDKHESLRWGE